MPDIDPAAPAEVADAAPPQPIPFRFYRILCTTPPELEDERLAFESAVSAFVGRVTMPDKILFAAASLRPPILAANQMPLIEANIRMCEFIVAVFGEAWPDPVFGSFIHYSLTSIADPDRATRAACAFFRNYASAAPEVRQLRESLEKDGQCAVRDFTNTTDFPAQVEELLSHWYAPLRPAVKAD
jgi:hypothetical protein